MRMLPRDAAPSIFAPPRPDWVWPTLPAQTALALAALCLLAVMANMAVTAAAGFHFGFTHDDLMNTHLAVGRGWGALLGDVPRPWTVSPVYRPTGALWLKGVYSLFGMDIFAWRLLYGLLLVLSAGVTFLLARRLSGSTTAGVVAGLLVCYQVNLRHLYFSMGLIFDVLASVLGGLLLLSYLRLRCRGAGVAAWVAWLALVCLTLQAKEIGLASVASLVLLELLDEPPHMGQLRRWLRRRVPLLCACLLSAGFAAGRLFDANSLTYLTPYRVDLSARVYLTHLGRWMAELLQRPEPTDGGLALGVATVLLGLGLAALVRFSRLVAWCGLSFLIGIAPVAFIQLRGLDAVFVPLLPLAILAGVAAAATLRGAALLLRRAPDGFAVAATIMLAWMIVVWQGPAAKRAEGFAHRDADSAIVPAFASLHTLAWRVAAGDHILVEQDPFEEEVWAPTYVFRLYYGLLELDVRRAGMVSCAERRNPAIDWHRIEWHAGQWVVPRAESPAAALCR